MSDLPTLRIREWSRTVFAAERPVLTEADRHLLNELAQRTSLRVEELRRGLLIEVGPHIGVVTLSGLRLIIVPKLRLQRLMQMVAYAFDLDDLLLSRSGSDYSAADAGFVDLLGLSLWQAVGRIVRAGLLPRYQETAEDLASPRGRIHMRQAAIRPEGSRLRCSFDELTTDHLLNQVLAAGLRLAAQVMENGDLGKELARAAGRWFGGHTRIALNSAILKSVSSSLDRRSSHYKTAVALIAFIFQGSHLGDYARAGEMPLAGFLLNMNRLFERFISRYLQENAPRDIEVVNQDVRAGVFAYLENPGGWKGPTIRPDLVFLRQGKPIAIGDAKYRNRLQRPPSAAELYQLTTYGLSYPIPDPRDVILFYPLEAEEIERPAQLLFAPDGGEQRVRIRLVGVPLEGILSQKCLKWWPPIPA